MPPQGEGRDAAPTAATSAEPIAFPSGIPPTKTSGKTSQISRVSTISALDDEGQYSPGSLVAGRYRILGMLGQGGMGEVYRATDLTLGQSVALKFLVRGAAQNEKWLERFHGEVRIARQISHPNVCRVYDIGEDDDVPFLSMEFVDGDDLATLLVGIGRLPADKATEIARKICAGLAAAHDKGVIHRDLKPQNIMMTKRGEILITDFGLAAVAETLAGPEARNGTPAYMAPEQLRGSEVTKKSDIYALGLLLYELYTGRRPYSAKNIPELLGLQESQQLTSMTSIATDIDPAVEGIIKRCLHPDPGMRPASALAVAAALPGGDPLAAALAAGETPSPELLAASGKHDPVSLKRTFPALVAACLGLVALPFLIQRLYMPAYAAFHMSPEVLEQKARDNAALLGYTDRPVDSFSQLRYLPGFLPWASKNWNASKGWYKLFHAEPPLELFYRQSPRLLMSRPDGRVGENRPAQIISGQWQMDVDSLGRLRRFEAVPPQFEKDPPPQPPIAFDPRPLFQAAGLDLAKFTEVTPQWTPAAAFDMRRAWKGTHPTISEIPLTVEAASWRGQLIDAQLIWPWTKPTLMTQDPVTMGSIISNVLGIVFGTTGLLYCIWLARRNLKSGKGDRQGAWRIASVFF
ncbi:MAG: serine/threonine protein kinase, partial [Acidobacteria bacterium]|nr:serine/threonine protein kinase [Acidobacteriota bacterium]